MIILVTGTGTDIGKTVATVATRMGYSPTNGFTGAFRHHFGTTPV